MKLQSLLSLVFFALCPVAMAAATVVNIDFSRDITSPIGGAASALYSGVGIAPDNGTFWNNYSIYMPATGGDGGADSIVNPYTVDNLTASDGSTITSIGLSLSSGWYRAFNAQSADNDLQQEWVFANTGDTGNATLTGLTPNGAYDLYLYSSGNVATTYTVGSTSQSVVGNQFLLPVTSGTEGGAYTLFSSVVADGSGNIAFSAAGTSGGQAALAGLQIQAVPEPSTWTILAGSLAGLVFAIRRRI